MQTNFTHKDEAHPKLQKSPQSLPPRGHCLPGGGGEGSSSPFLKVRGRGPAASELEPPPAALRRVKTLPLGPQPGNVLTRAPSKSSELSLHAALNVKLILQVFSQDVTLTEPEMNQNAERVLRRLLPFRPGSHGVPGRSGLGPGLAGRTLGGPLPQRARPPLKQTCAPRAAGAPRAVRSELGARELPPRPAQGGRRRAPEGGAGGGRRPREGGGRGRAPGGNGRPRPAPPAFGPQSPALQCVGGRGPFPGTCPPVRANADKVVMLPTFIAGRQ